MTQSKNQPKKIKPIYAFLVIGLALLIVFFAITQNRFFKISPSQGEKPSVVVTLFPFFSLAKELVSEDMEVAWLTLGQDAHSFTPQPQDLETLKAASVVVYTSEAMSPWMDKVSKNLSSNTLIINLSEGVEGDLLAHDGHDEHHGEHEGHHDDHKEGHHDDHDKHHDDHKEGHHDEHHDDHAGHHDKHHDDHKEGHHDEHRDDHAGHHDKHHHDHGEFDPHFWLDFSITSKAIDYLSDNLIQAFPERKETIEANKQVLQEKLSALHEKYQTSLASCGSKDFYLLGHNAFSYVAERYDLHYTPFIDNLSSQAEMRLKSFMGITSEIEKEKVKYVFYEETEKSPKNRSLMENAKVELLPLSNANVLTPEQIDQGVSYFDIMEGNLASLKKGLDCQ